MEKLIVDVPAEVKQKLRLKAAENGESIKAVVLNALVPVLESVDPETIDHAKPDTEELEIS